MDSALFMPNEPNFRSSRPRHWRAGDAGSRHADKLGPRWIGWPRLARNGTGRPGNWVASRPAAAPRRHLAFAIAVLEESRRRPTARAFINKECQTATGRFWGDSGGFAPD